MLHKNAFDLVLPNGRQISARWYSEVTYPKKLVMISLDWTRPKDPPLYGSCGRTPKSVRSELNCFSKGNVNLFQTLAWRTFKELCQSHKLPLNI